MSITDLRVRTAPTAPSGPSADTTIQTGWLRTWITIGILVVLVVIGYLIPISNALTSIDRNLAVADEAVTGAGGDVVPLPDHVANINGSLSGIDTALAPVPGQADQIIAALSSIRDSLSRVDASLRNTSGSLGGTSRSLVDTSNILQQVLDLASQIEATLELAESPADDLGTSDIFERVAVANDILAPARGDTSNILAQLRQVNEHLVSICQALGGPQC